MQTCMAQLQVCTTAATLPSENKEGAIFLLVTLLCCEPWIKRYWEGREVKQHCGLLTTHPQARLWEGDAVSVLPAHKFYGLSPEAAQHLVAGGEVSGECGRGHSDSLQRKAGLETRINELWMADHYPLIKTETQKPDETNKTTQSRHNCNFI